MKGLTARLADRANPILLKELWQSVHSRLLMAVFWITLMIALVIYCLSFAGGGRDMGGVMFAAFAGVMAPIVLYVIPVAAFVSLRREITGGTLELVQVTGLAARRLVRGRLEAAGVRVLLLLALLAPFAVTLYLFGGVDVVQIVATVYLLMLASLLACAAAVFWASLAAYRSIRTITLVGFVATLLCPLLLVDSGAVRPITRLTADPIELTFLLAIWTVVVLLSVLLLNAASANALSFAHARSSCRTKVALAMVIGALLAAPVVGALVAGHMSLDSLVAFTWISCLLVAVCGPFWLTADAHVPQRHRRMLERRGPVTGALYKVLRDGPVPTAVYLALVAGFMFVAADLVNGLPGSSRTTGADQLAYRLPIAQTLAFVLYVSAVAGVVTRLLPVHRRTANSRRMVWVYVAGATSVPMLLLEMSWGGSMRVGRSPLTALLPLLLMFAQGRGALSDLVLPLAVGVIYYSTVGLLAKPQAAGSARKPQPAVE